MNAKIVMDEGLLLGSQFSTKKVHISLNTASLEAIFMKNQALEKWVLTQGRWEFEDHLLCIWSLDIMPSDDTKGFFEIRQQEKTVCKLMCKSGIFYYIEVWNLDLLRIQKVGWTGVQKSSEHFRNCAWKEGIVA